jgi:CheY-like chemotaxis protein
METRAPRTTAEFPAPRGASVLLVDDDFAILDGIAELLEGEGFSVVSASNGIDALNQLRSGLLVDVIVLDVMMPIMDGWDFRAEQLADPSLRETPVVVITAYGFSQSALQQQLNAYDVLAKPLEIGPFLVALRSACAAGTPGAPPSAATIS